MTIEIHQSEIEEIIQQRLATGAFQDVEDVLIHALRTASPSVATVAVMRGFGGSDLLDAMRASPFKEIDLEISGSTMPVRDVSL